MTEAVAAPTYREPFWGPARCYHCGRQLSHCVISGMWYPDCPYECAKHGAAMERWEGVLEEHVTDEDRERWWRGCECGSCEAA